MYVDNPEGNVVIHNACQKFWDQPELPNDEKESKSEKGGETALDDGVWLKPSTKKSSRVYFFGTRI
jgi:hypothetical protein